MAAALKIHRNSLIVGIIWLFALGIPVQAQEQVHEHEWPQQIEDERGTLLIYQPQPESLQGDKLRARAAISMELADRDEPIFGAMWFESRIATNRDTGIATVMDIKVQRVGWPDSKDAQEQSLISIVEAAFPEHGFDISLERLSASLETADIERSSLAALKNDPPVILFEDQLAVLLLFDGEPKFEEVADTPYERAVNTPFLVAREGSGTLWLSDGARWFTAADPLGPWSVSTRPPQDFAKMVAEAAKESGSTDDEPAGEAPMIVVATEPTELIVTDGKPSWQTLEGGELLYVENTETPWLRQLETGNMYLLLSGRWFRSKSVQGPWVFVPADELPKAFADISPASPLGGLRTSVAGTEEAEQAMLDAAIPQTAAIKRSGATLTVSYDGKPKFEQIKGTQVAYAVNTSAQVLEINGRYYAVDDGVWFTAIAPQGPWSVADDIPEEQIATIPPSAPVYNLKHVHIYDSTPEVVYVGYTPGYMWSFPYYGVPVYGTGWYYPPYWGGIYYPRPPTWGLHVGYNPWTGWNFGVSWSNGFMRIGVSWGGGWGCCGGWYGGGYRGPTFINTGDINIGNNTNIGNRIEGLDRDRVGLAGGDRPGRGNLYDRPENRERLASKTQRDQLKRARPASDRANNVFADANGKIARRTPEGWESRQNGQWKREAVSRDAARTTSSRAATTSSRDLNRSSSMNRGGFNQNDFNRAHRARSVGASREMRRPARGGRRR
ncbi:MAG: hypothetical protein Cons2KO_14890 [Congregibacter sp.]